jgi:ubiquinone/menaquinone biosynthesis C-methylase UbiE
MRKDYIAAEEPADHETEFVEKYWTGVWEQEGGPQGLINRIPRKDEYRVMAPYMANLPKGARVLDGGCGLGDWVLAFQREGFSVVGLDLSRKTVEQLKARFPETEFMAGDIRETGFPDGSFDAYFSWGVIEHFESGPQDCLREAWRILKPGGLLFISVPMDNLRHALL